MKFSLIVAILLIGAVALVRSSDEKDRKCRDYGLKHQLIIKEDLDKYGEFSWVEYTPGLVCYSTCRMHQFDFGFLYYEPYITPCCCANKAKPTELI